MNFGEKNRTYMKKVLVITGVVSVVVYVLIFLYYLFIISGAFLMLNYFSPNPPKPEIRYCEFPFTLHSVSRM